MLFTKVLNLFMPEGVELAAGTDCSEARLCGPEGVLNIVPEGVSLCVVPEGVRVVVPEGIILLL